VGVFNRILVATDGSPIAARAVDSGAGLARDEHAQLAFVFVVDPEFGAAPEGGLPTETLLEGRRGEAKYTLEAAVGRSEASPPPWTFVKEGKASSEILAAAEEWGADLIVMGTHGRSGIGRVVLGSVAEAVLHQSRCPVLMVKTT
jgi:nucleotide-binding universal stress UspA family protein